MGSLRSAFASPAAKRRYVGELFQTIADRYDLVTRLLSFGLDQRWKRSLVAMATTPGGKRALDLACGTGDIAVGVAAAGAQVVGLDLVPRMVVLARSRADGVGEYLVGDMGELPLPSASFDLITTGYGLRNVPDLDQALREIYRVLRPDGQFLSLDFNRPANPAIRVVYLGYLTVVGSVLGTLLHGDPDTYRYIAASLARYPGAAGVAHRMRACGFREAGARPLLGGLMAINYGTK